MRHKEYNRCLICGRKLKNEKCRLIGYGEVCYKKFLIKQSKNNKLFSLNK